MTIPIARRAFLGVVVLLLAHVPAAMGAGFNLFWNDCGAGPGVWNRTFSCSTNSGSNTLVVSFDPPYGITKLVGMSAVIDVITASTPVPSWWQFGPGACRAGALHLDFIAPTPSCVDYWSTSATGSFSYSLGVNGDPRRARIVVSCGIPEGLAGPVDAGTEHYAFRLTLDMSKSTGSGSCTGCIDPVCIGLTSLWLYQPSGLGNYGLCNPLLNNLATVNGGQIGGAGCPGTDGPPAIEPDCAATPVTRHTWGRIKGLYR